MKLPHPACGFPTQFVVKLLAVCDLIFGLVGIFWFVYILDGYGLLMEDPSIYNNNRLSTPATTNIQSNLTKNVTIVPAPHDFTYNNVGDVHSRNHSLISVTDDGIQIHGTTANIVLSSFYTLINLIAFVLLLSASHEKNTLNLKIWWGIRVSIFVFKIILYSMYFAVGAPIFSQIPHIIFMAIHLYGLWLVFVFIKEIKAERQQAVLTETENGTPYQTSYTNFANTVEGKS